MRGEQRSIVLLGVFSDLPFESSAARIGELMFGTSFPSISNFYSAMSNGKTWLSGNVYQVDLGRYADNPDSRTRLWNFATQNLDLSQIKRLIFITNKSYGGVGDPVRPRNVNGQTYYFSLTQGSYTMDGTTDRDKKLEEYGLVKLLLHEMGHSLGLPHSNFVVCSETFGEGSSECGVQEYGNLTPIMGWGDASLDAAQRTYLGFLEEPDTLVSTTGLFQLKPLEGGSGLRHLSVPIGQRSINDPYCNSGATSLSLEYRRKVGYDAAIADYSAGVREGLYLNTQISPCIRGGDDLFQKYERELLIDPSPGSIELAPSQTYALKDQNDAVLLAQNGFYDRESRTAINILSVNTAYAEVELRQDSAGCERAAPQLNVLDQQVNGTTATISYRITNMDSAPCGDSTFALDLKSLTGINKKSTELNLGAGQRVDSAIALTLAQLPTKSTNLLSLDARNKSALHFSATNLVELQLAGCYYRLPTLQLLSQFPLPAAPRNVPSTFTLRLTNNDTANCAARSFNLDLRITDTRDYFEGGQGIQSWAIELPDGKTPTLPAGTSFQFRALATIAGVDGLNYYPVADVPADIWALGPDHLNSPATSVRAKIQVQ